jgi:predicted nucleic acid-binding Zn ribbon protein
MLRLLERLMSWRQRLKRLPAASRHTEDRKHGSASPAITRRDDISRNELYPEASHTNSALPVVVVTDVDGKLAVPDSW